MSEEKPKKQMPRGKRFGEGQPSNLAGRPAMLPEVVESRKLNRQTFEMKLHDMLQTPMTEVEKVLENREKTKAMSIDCIAASIIVRAVNDGCIQRTNFLLSKIGINPKFVEHDPLTNVTPAEQEQQQSQQQLSEPKETAPFYIVEINRNGKFMRSRPREMVAAERLPDVDENKVSNG